MSKYTAKIVRFFNQIRGFFPTRLPVGVAAFEEWTDHIMATYDMPTDSRASVQFVLASIVLHLGETVYRKPNFYFYKVIQTSAAKQVSSYVFQEIKAQQQAAATASTTQVANGQQATGTA